MDKKVNLFGWMGKCHHTDLPSSHPFWTWMVLRIYAYELEREKALLAECKANPALYKYYFNLTATEDQIQLKIDNRERDIKKRISQLRERIN